MNKSDMTSFWLVYGMLFTAEQQRNKFPDESLEDMYNRLLLFLDHFEW
jgi:hypothetical protein